MADTTNLLIIVSDDGVAKALEGLAGVRGWTFAIARGAEEALAELSRVSFEASIVDIGLPGFSSLQLLEYCRKNQIYTEIVVAAPEPSAEAAVAAVRQGAYDFLTIPLADLERAALTLEKAMDRFRIAQKLRRLERRTSEEGGYEGIVGKSVKIQEVFEIIESIAPSTSTVLIMGESGTGKELVARAIHARSSRSEGPFVVINCATIPVHLLESELFGHKRGSFTGAVADKRGLFEEAHGGTAFLDEIGEMPPSLQVKLLRVLQEGEVRPVGDVASHHVDVRLIAATNRDLVALVREGAFREDLFYRINVIGVTLPPLRERPEDIPLLSYHFLRKYAQRLRKPIERISLDALQALQSYSWVGNVRELENTIERACVLASGVSITAQDLPVKVLSESFYQLGEGGVEDFTKYGYQEAKGRALTSFNRTYLSALLREAHGNISFASERAGMDRSNFKKLIKRYAIETGEYRRGPRR
jgi:two-component system, NtrC family, response regulator HydG